MISTQCLSVIKGVHNLKPVVFIFYTLGIVEKATIYIIDLPIPDSIFHINIFIFCLLLFHKDKVKCRKNEPKRKFKRESPISNGKIKRLNISSKWKTTFIFLTWCRHFLFAENCSLVSIASLFIKIIDCQYRTYFTMSSVVSWSTCARVSIY